MDEPPKKRKFWQFHLSTAVILMLAMGGMITATMTIGVGGFMSCGLHNNSVGKTYGIPLPFMDIVTTYANDVDENAVRPQTFVRINKPLALVVDAIAAFLILVAFALISEWLIRRREGRKP